MDQSLKQRLLGVVIFTALAAIFVPMLFDDPVEDTGRSISELTIPDSPKQSFEQTISAAPSSVEQVLELPEPDYIMAESELEEINTQPVAADPVPQPEVVANPVVRPSTAKQHMDKQAKLERWFIQVASLSSVQGAKALQENLIKQGFHASYDTFRTASNKLFYRVRVGPELNKQRAQQMQGKIDQLNAVKSRLMKE